MLWTERSGRVLPSWWRRWAVYFQLHCHWCSTCQISLLAEVYPPETSCPMTNIATFIYYTENVFEDTTIQQNSPLNLRVCNHCGLLGPVADANALLNVFERIQSFIFIIHTKPQTSSWTSHLRSLSNVMLQWLSPAHDYWLTASVTALIQLYTGLLTVCSQ